ncbi:uncharacterized protein ASCRUDRAFT_62455 [Ascoidea rubescens DSM 1968]|uniref:Uncharacterized protein n=1 Tax=Ascoidea rubescens DSM 1968 TaxID=1344418 RepID=A0A1D2VA15_9ASCO|nr:hypothetical protein ASCRUDRAFT_62455 [Ascoidea rubescens DSM 1968]ODV58484.1 hypothetical protein ASCRUDRAFT_62455 [Ascoidea rubescens DSM 1968]
MSSALTADSINQTNLKITQIPETSSYVAHLSTLPALAALTGLVASFPVPKIFASNAIPLLIYMKDKNANQIPLDNGDADDADDEADDN